MSNKLGGKYNEILYKLENLSGQQAKSILLFMLGYMSQSKIDGDVAFQEGIETALIEYDQPEPSPATPDMEKLREWIVKIDWVTWNSLIKDVNAGYKSVNVAGRRRTLVLNQIDRFLKSLRN